MENDFERLRECYDPKGQTIATLYKDKNGYCVQSGFIYRGSYALPKRIALIYYEDAKAEAERWLSIKSEEITEVIYDDEN